MTNFTYNKKELTDSEIARLQEYSTYAALFEKYEDKIDDYCFDIGNSILMVKEFLYAANDSTTNNYRHPDFIRIFNEFQDIVIDYVEKNLTNKITNRRKFITFRVLVNALYGVTVPKSDYIIKNKFLTDVLDIFLHREKEILTLKEKIEKMNEAYLSDINSNMLRAYDEASQVQERIRNDKMPEGMKLQDGILNGSIYRPLVVGVVSNGTLEDQDVMNIYAFLSIYRSINAKLEDILNGKKITTPSNMFPEYKELNEVVYKAAKNAFTKLQKDYSMLEDSDPRIEGYDERLLENKEFYQVKSAYDLFLNIRTDGDNPTKALWLADRRMKWSLETKDAFHIMNTLRNNFLAFQNVSIGKLIDYEETYKMAFNNNHVFFKVFEEVLDAIKEYVPKIQEKDRFQAMYISNLIQFVVKYTIKPNWEKGEIKGKRIIKDQKAIDEELEYFFKIREKALDLKNDILNKIVDELETLAVSEINKISEEKGINYRMISIALGINSAVLSKIRNRTRRVQQLEYFIDICAIQGKTIEDLLRKEEVAPVDIPQSKMFV